jgi:hypothetical protein
MWMFMRRVIVVALAGASLAGCSSVSSWNVFKSAPPNMQVQLDSNPPGADASTSLGPGCKTPCSVTIPVPEGNFSVSYTLAKYQPASVPVNVVKNPGDLTTAATVTTDPNPVFAELQPATPPKPVRKKPLRPRKPTPAAAAPAEAVPAAAPAAGSVFPDPNAAPPPQAAAPSR